ncbi:MAG: IS1595 family transposase [Gammaproteobacteria bacterium]|nr:IS1595 family transposase [Gammaproteobacteria bacterium]
MAGKSDRDGISLTDLFGMFPDDSAAERWMTQARWPNGVACPHCGSVNVQSGAKHHSMPYRCRDCRRRFSLRTGTAMADSKLGYRVWAIGIYLFTTSLKGVSSMKLHRDLGISQKAAWHLAHRLRQAWDDYGEQLVGPVEVDETYVGGLEKNKHEDTRRHVKGRIAEKLAVVGLKDRETGQVRARFIPDTRGDTLRAFVREHARRGSQVYSDGHGAYLGLAGEYRHRAVQHSVGTYVIADTHTNGIESFWSMLKRGYVGTYHKMSGKHLQRYVDEFTGRHNARELDTLEQMRRVVRGLVGKRLQYQELTA